MDRRKAGGIANKNSSKCVRFIFNCKLLDSNGLVHLINQLYCHVESSKGYTGGECG